MEIKHHFYKCATLQVSRFHTEPTRFVSKPFAHVCKSILTITSGRQLLFKQALVPWHTYLQYSWVIISCHTHTVSSASVRGCLINAVPLFGNDYICSRHYSTIPLCFISISCSLSLTLFLPLVKIEFILSPNHPSAVKVMNPPPCF